MKEAIEYFFFALVSRIARGMSFRTAGRFGARLGGLIFRLTRFRRAVTDQNLEHAFPEKTPADRRTIALGAYRSYATALVEMLWSGGATAGELMEILHLENREVPDQALARGKGLILLSGHYGSWELLANALPMNLGTPFIIIAQNQRNGKIDSAIHASRQRFGSTTVPMGRSVREILSRLRQGGIAAMLADQSGSRESLYVQFFGRPAATHRGPAVFSLKTGAPIVMVYLERLPSGKYHAVFEEVDQSGLNDAGDEAVAELTRRHTGMLEKRIRLHPEQWLWMHKRWKHTEYFERTQGQSKAQQAVHEGAE